MSVDLAANVAGGIGLFLLGMMLMTDGLKLAAGRALRHILREWTRTPVRSLLSGVLITSLVQSSSAVTVAIIGFVNAGLLGLLETVYVVFGSNIGSTMTSWLVALVGFKVDVKVMALPLIAAGMALRLTAGTTRRGSLGIAFAGFGLFFLGIDVLKETFTGLERDIDLRAWHHDGPVGMLIFVGIGFVLTLLMQSSAAAMVITLTAAAGGMITLTAAAAVVIGANVGTTSTAALSVIGATSNAKRTAAAHVLFNLLTGAVALVLVAPLLSLIATASGWLGVNADVVITLALFHTVFNLLGVVLLWPFVPRLSRFLETRFRSVDEDLGRPRFLDRNVVTTPALAVDALTNELSRIGEFGRTMAKEVLSSETLPDEHVAGDRQVIGRLADSVRQFTVQVQRSDLPADLVETIPNAIRVARYFEEAAEAAVVVANAQHQLSEVTEPALAEQMAHFRGECVALIGCSDPAQPGYSASDCRQRLEELERHYQDLKAALLRAGAREQIQVRQMVAQLDQYSAIRRLVEQVEKGAEYTVALMDLAARYREPPAAEPQATEGG